MLHHVDVHVRDLQAAQFLFDALCETIGYRPYAASDDFVGYEPTNGGRPRIGFILDQQHAGGTLRLAFSVRDREHVDKSAAIAKMQGARFIEGPGLNPEYGDDYYAAFFEDADGNKYEVVADAGMVPQPRIARMWRARVQPNLVRAYRRYITATGIADYRNTPGNCGAWILTAPHGDHADVITLSFWDTKENIARFAGKPIERAQYYPEDKEYLLDFPEKVEHFDLE